MIEELRPLTARSRQRVKPRLAKLLEWLRSQRIVGGVGVKVLQTDQGTFISSSLKPSFVGAFRVTGASQSVRVGVGFVNGIMPTINNKPLSEGPELEIPKASGQQPLYIMLSVEVEKDSGRINEKNKEAVKIVASTSKAAPKPQIGLHPIAVFYPLQEGPKLYQLAYFSYNHAFRNDRHFFVPA
jgi:hypothetical protein